MEQRKVIAVANPHLIEGGLATVHAAVATYLPEGSFVLEERHVPQPTLFKPRSSKSVAEAAHFYAREAFKSREFPPASLGIALVQGTSGILNPMQHTHAVAVDNVGMSGHGSSHNAVMDEEESLTYDDEVNDILRGVLKSRLSKAP